MKNWLRRKLRGWLGVNELSSDLSSLTYGVKLLDKQLGSALEGAADVSFRGNTQVIVLSRFKGGTVQIYDLNCKDGREIMGRCQDILGPAYPNSIIDAPAGFKRAMRDYAHDFKGY